jgi:hypothetical protein
MKCFVARHTSIFALAELETAQPQSNLKFDFSKRFLIWSLTDGSSSSCWPCSQSYNVGGENPRCRRKTLIGMLCLFLVFVVVLAIIIFAVTRDSVGTSLAKEYETGGGRKHEDEGKKPFDQEWALTPPPEFGEERSLEQHGSSPSTPAQKPSSKSTLASKPTSASTTPPVISRRSDINEFKSLGS